MQTTTASADCLIIGSGLAGLHAAHQLASAGVQALVLEKETVPGGRAATLALETAQGTAMADSGAQYFTVRDEVFRRQVEHWLAAGMAREWSRGFAVAGDSPYMDSYPRYCGSAGMAAIAAHLSQRALLRLNSEVTEIAYHDGWQVRLSTGEQLEAAALLLTQPVPQSLALLAVAGIPLPPGDQTILARLDYDPCLAVVVALAQPSHVPAPGGLWPATPGIYWMADNAQKGISTLPSVTIHATPEYSRARWEAESSRIAGELLAEASPWLGSDVLVSQVQRWRYSIPLHSYPARTLLLEAPGLLALAGDAFAGPRVEGAVLSGFAAGDALAAALRR